MSTELSTRLIWYNTDMMFEKMNKYWKSIKENFRKHLVCDESALRREATFAVAAFVVVLFWALWLKFNDFSMVVLNYRRLSEMTVKERVLYGIVPFQIRYDFIRELLQFPANAAIFAPLGVALPHAFRKKNIWRDLAICFGISLSIELVQLFTCIGSIATDDLIMNTLGYFIGFAAYRWIFSKLSCKVMVWIYRVINALLLIVLAVVVITTVRNWELIVAILTRTL